MTGWSPALGSSRTLRSAKRCLRDAKLIQDTGVKLLVKDTDIACVRDTFWVVRPAGYLSYASLLAVAE